MGLVNRALILQKHTAFVAKTTTVILASHKRKQSILLFVQTTLAEYQ
jgi:hypothetical protein